MGSQHDLVSQSAFEFVQQYISKEDQILEIGSGEGNLVQKFTTYNYNIVGIEKSSKKVALARKKGIDLIHTDVNSLHYDQPFDVILLIRVLHHANYQSILTQANQLLKDNGQLIIEEFVRERVSSMSLTWLFDILSILQTAGLAQFETSFPGIYSPKEIWDQYYHNPDLPAFEDILGAITDHFEIVEQHSIPYLYRYVANRLKEGSRNNRIIQKIKNLEQDRINRNQFDGVGIRIVAENQ